MSKLTIQQFKELLEADEEHERIEHARQEQHKQSSERRYHEQIQQSIRNVWESFDVLIPSNLDTSNQEQQQQQTKWKRPLPEFGLYRCTQTSSLTTLIEWNTLPLPIQTNLIQSGWIRPEVLDECTKEQYYIVEVPTTYMTLTSSSNDNTVSGGGMVGASILSNQRPLQGNLTDKLSEFTRGTATGGKSNTNQSLFRPGGIDATDLMTKSKLNNYNNNNVSKEQQVSSANDGAVENVDQYRTEEAIKFAQTALEIGSEQAWLDQTILTSPPGVQFKVGISWNDVYGQENNNTTSIKEGVVTEGYTFNEINYIDNTSGSNYLYDKRNNSIIQPVSTTGTSKKAGMFSKGYFDDDSLFGSSSSEEDDDDNDEDNDSGSGDDNNDNNKEYDAPYQKPILSDTTQAFDRTKSNNNDDDDNITDANEIDMLLKELTLNDTTKILNDKINNNNNNTNKIKYSDDIDKMNNSNINSVQLSEYRKLDQSNTTRKSWASIKLLPIHDFSTYIPNPALVYPFQLDDFQQQAIARLERSESVFVAAHTSAGKTVVAEYAIALAMQRSTRCVYTSPIKALSNQKFRDFCVKFGSKNVGLITGDLQVNVDDSTCLIMTTEILRSMLYRGADLIRDIESVIFDEVHYINDTERGVVWEEVIIMLPSYVNMIFLSATTPNTLEFSDWIGRTKRKPVHVIKTNYRPVPLSHHLWAGSKLHKVLVGNGAFLESGYAAATEHLLPQSAKDPNKKKTDQKGSGKPLMGGKQLAWQSQGTKNDWMSLVRFLERELLTPTVVFVFSKKKCEEIANMLISLDLNTSKERAAILAFTLQTVRRLSQNDSKLPQVLTVCEMVQRGIGIHHGGLLPILKEMVEILFSRNLIKVLFATETFAMGVNMPAKAVVFYSIRKHDGSQFRMLEPGEYTQMAGRAGRRGLDDVGTVIICCFGETPPPQPILKHMLTGTSTKLSSQFRLTYNMILNLLRVEEISVESMIKRSFSEFATQRALTVNEYPQLLARGTRTLAKLEEDFQRDDFSRIGAEDLEEYYTECTRLSDANEEVFTYIRESDAISFEDLFPTGRILFVTISRHYSAVCSPSIILRSPSSSSVNSTDISSTNMVCLILLPAGFVPETNPTKSKAPGTVGYQGMSQQRYYIIDEVSLDQIRMIVSGKRKTIDAKTLLKIEDKTKTFDSQQSNFFNMSKKVSDPFAGMKAIGKKDSSTVQSSGATESQTLDQVVGYLIDSERDEKQMHSFDSFDIQSLVKRGNNVLPVRETCQHVDHLIEEMRAFVSHRHPNLAKLYASIARKETLKSKVETLRHLLSNESLQLFPDFLQRKEVLQKLGYVDKGETVCVKGRVACEVNTCDELVATEMVFEGLLDNLEPEEIAAVLSALVYQERNDNEGLDSELPERLVDCCQQLKIIALNLGQMQKEQGLSVDPGEYCEKSLNFGLVHVVYEWAMGVPFKSICDLTMAQEGSIVRCITRLDELCREIRNCSRVVGNATLYRKMEAASTAIKRDIVFASSLYIN